MEEYIENGMKLRVLHKKPLIFEIENFFSDEECETIIKHSKEHMTRALIGSYEKMHESKIRTGSAYYLKYGDNEDLFQIFKRISMLLNKPGRNFDQAFQVIHYGQTEYYELHVDPSGERNKRDGIKHRKFTILSYINDVEEGGETEFPKLGLKVPPKKGKLVYFDNYKKGKINQECLHRGCPVKKGEKWAFNLWYHDK